MDYLAHLNPPQREGVENLEGPTMIIAGAGSGKTRVLTYRIAHLIRSKDVDPFKILALTFTNKAAKEMRERIEKVVGTDARNLWMGTFHSVFSRILRAESDKLGYPSNFTIYDTDDSKSLIKNIVREMGLDEKLYKANVVYNRISGAKNNLISWQNYISNPVYISDDEQAQKPKMGAIYKEYVQRCFRAGAMDFDDLLFNTNILFRDHLDVLNKYQQRFQYVMIDEFQDTNISQYLITKRLASVHQNICVVGDDAQSIYAFRGANIQNILNFEKDYPDLSVIKLEQNYRSTQNIVNAANSVIVKNSAQLKKSVWTENDHGEKVHLIKATSDNEEGRLVASSIFEDRSNKKLENKDFAILYRTNSQSRSMEEALRKMNIPYRIFGGLSFYQRREIKDLLAYLRFTINQNDEQSFRRIINLPKRGIGGTSVDKIMVAAFENERPLWDVLNNIQNFLPGRAANAVQNFVTLIKSFRIKLEREDAFETASFIAKQSGLLKELYDDKTIEGLNRYENVQELLNAIKEFVDSTESEDKSLEAFIADVALLTDADNQDPNDTNYVNMMTIHSAKGLEFKHVYIVGMEEDLFPSQMMLNSRADLEEERRLFYVALTRAMEKVTLTYALSRYRFGRLKSCEPSRFIEEIDPEFLKVDRKFNSSEPMGSMNNGSSNSLYARNLVAKRKATTPKVPPGKKLHTPSADFKPSDTRSLDTGMRVEHPKFGFGKVVKMDVDGANRKATIEFELFGEKTLLLTFAKLRILED
ncbi:3'-5' exonuclease [Marivirga atlantica]|jgi:DNA helicase-2/ATP-dependent DNA helicase PcrA|uniref:DNA 3'-5' helicase n=1 Tax=Marivirga atlantica TaxID=1548457 RepID=A0A937DHN6_9BACT|nr:UvrD-helicase domain-containing protein [Marivirga atlantica]MBL0766113.1 UvrD-helicase domain-containing protein [Marivirga atlantica]